MCSLFEVLKCVDEFGVMELEQECGPSTFDYLNHYTGTVGSIFLNTLLMCAIKLRKRTDLNVYTILLNVNCVVDLINSLYNCLSFLVSFLQEIESKK